VIVILLLVNEPVLEDRGGGAGGLGGGVLALDLDGHVLVLLEGGGEVGLLGRLGGLGQAEGGYVAGRVAVLDWGRLVGLEFFEVELLDEVGWTKEKLADGETEGWGYVVGVKRGCGFAGERGLSGGRCGRRRELRGRLSLLKGPERGAL
jgi:hypothetical protein